jgi:hypothetical protein
VNLGDNPADDQTEVYTLYRPSGIPVPAPLPTATGAQTVTNNTTFNTGALIFDYIVAKFGQDASVFYIGNLSGELTIPNLTGNTNGLSGYTLVNGRNNPNTPGVPDGGTSVVLLGLALGALALIKRSFAR